MHVNTLETDSERRKNISGNGSLFILFVKVKKDAQKESICKGSPFFNVLQKCIHLSLCLEKREQKGWKTREFVCITNKIHGVPTSLGNAK